VARTVDMIGLLSEELAWVRLLVDLLRHPDPVIAHLSRQSLLYVQQAAAGAGQPEESRAVAVPRAENL
jgi:hypothetical protein